MGKISLKIMAAAGIVAAALLGGYYLGTVLPGNEADLTEQPQAETLPLQVSQVEAAPISETEIAGGDTCTVLPQKIELLDGTLCEVVDDIPFMAEDEPANYKCSDGS